MTRETCSRMDHRGRITIPKRIRECAGLRSGDLLAFTQRGAELRVRRLSRPDGYLLAVEKTMSEWNSPDDEAAWRHL